MEVLVNASNDWRRHSRSHLRRWLVLHLVLWSLCVSQPQIGSYSLEQVYINLHTLVLYWPHKGGLTYDCCLYSVPSVAKGLLTFSTIPGRSWKNGKLISIPWASQDCHTAVRDSMTMCSEMVPTIWTSSMAACESLRLLVLATIQLPHLGWQR